MGVARGRAVLLKDQIVHILEMLVNVCVCVCISRVRQRCSWLVGKERSCV